LVQGTPTPSPRLPHADKVLAHRIDKDQSFEDKVEAVNKLLAKDDLLEDDAATTTSETASKSP